jgi:hypothetical protein
MKLIAQIRPPKPDSLSALANAKENEGGRPTAIPEPIQGLSGPTGTGRRRPPPGRQQAKEGRVVRLYSVGPAIQPEAVPRGGMRTPAGEPSCLGKMANTDPEFNERRPMTIPTQPQDNRYNRDERIPG